MPFLLALCTIFLLSISFTINKIIVIPFKKLPLKSDFNNTQFINYISNNELLTDINIGTPIQKLSFIIRTSSYFSYVLQDTGNETKPYKDYHSENSSTYIKIRNCTSSEFSFSDAEIMNETVYIGNINIYNMTLIRALNYTQIKDYNIYSGLFGLGLLEGNDIIPEINLLINLKNKDIINTYNFFIEYNSNTEGNIVIGCEPNEYNNIKYPNKINAFSRLPKYKSVFWGMLTDNIYYGDYNLKLLSENNVKIKLDYGLILVGPDIKKILDRDLFGELIKKNICIYDKSTLNFIYVCEKGKVDKSKLHEFKIYNKDFNMNFTIDFKDLLYDYNNKTYFLVEFGFSASIILGEPFIKKYNIVYNQDLKRLGMYIKETNENNNKTFIIIIIILLLLLIITILSIVFFKYFINICKNQRKKGIELPEDDDYIKVNDNTN